MRTIVFNAVSNLSGMVVIIFLLILPVVRLGIPSSIRKPTLDVEAELIWLN